ncbi:MAG TPA: chaperone modulator CbpM [Burkholderiales bacterium]|nr:chaperone modulator CbpM [Burkholderiales bacterium]
MSIELTEAQWLHEQTGVSVEELAQLSGLSPELLHELVDYGALVPMNVESAQWTFTADCVIAVRAASRLREDFDLDANALSVAINLIERIHGLEAQLQQLRSQLPSLRIRR